MCVENLIFKHLLLLCILLGIVWLLSREKRYEDNRDIDNIYIYIYIYILSMSLLSSYLLSRDNNLFMSLSLLYLSLLLYNTNQTQYY